MEKELILKNIAQNLRMERLRKRYTQEKLAEAAGITQKYLNMIKNAKVNPSVIIVVNICIALEISPRIIFDFI